MHSGFNATLLEEKNFFSLKIVFGHSAEWLDRKEPINIAVKIVLSIGAGYIIGAFYLIYLILRFLGLMSRM